ncbi:MAG: peptide chain release factor N(5)-glutamine methyltransferase [Chitinophagaceae bacterium]
MTLKEAQIQLKTALQVVYEDREATTITDWVLEHLTGWKKIDRVMNKDNQLSDAITTQLQQYTGRLLQHEPVQYVLHEAWFYGMPLYVDENVLIPRPETEELVEWMIQEIRDPKGMEILDIGTGSGCIPIALKKQLPGARVSACDVSEGALAVAKRNAADQQVTINFIQVDFLQATLWPQLPQVDVIVSNPPYIPLRDKATMHNNVLDHEPHLALFVPDNDALLFYRNIANFGLQQLNPGGKIFLEIHEDLGKAVCDLFTTKGFTRVELKKDMQGKERMVKAEMR